MGEFKREIEVRLTNTNFVRIARTRHVHKSLQIALACCFICKNNESLTTIATSKLDFLFLTGTNRF